MRLLIDLCRLDAAVDMSFCVKNEGRLHVPEHLLKEWKEEVFIQTEPLATPVHVMYMFV